MPIGPDEAKPELIVDADAVLPGPIATQGFQTIPGRDPQVIQRCRDLEHVQLAQGDLLDLPPASHGNPGKERAGIRVAERADHD